MKIELVVYDLAGTTIEDRDTVGRSFREALEAVGVVPDPADVTAVMGLPKPEAFRRLVEKANRPELLERLTALHDDFVARMVRHYRESPEARPIPGAVEAFQKTHEIGAKVAVNSGFSRVIIDVILDRFGWVAEGLVDASLASDEVERGRPDPEMIHRLMMMFEIADPKRIAKVGDTPADLEEGTNAGCGLVVGVTEGTHSRAQLERIPHTHLIPNIRAFPELLETVASGSFGAS